MLLGTRGGRSGSLRPGVRSGREPGVELLLLTADPDVVSVLPALSLLRHRVRSVAPEVAVLVNAGACDAVLVDARGDLVGSRGLCRLLRSTGLDVPVVVVISEGGLMAVSADWGLDEILLSSAGPAEVDTRLRLLAARRASEASGGRGGALAVGELVIDEVTYTVWLRGRRLEFTYKEFELLKYLAQHAGRVFTRAQLLREVWGYDFFGGTRTVDVHVRRLRAKLGPEYDNLIATVRNVGYKFVRPVRRMNSRQQADHEHATTPDSADAVAAPAAARVAYRRPSPATTPTSHRRRRPNLTALAEHQTT